MFTPYEDLKPYNVDFTTLDQLAGFYRLYEYALENYKSDEYKIWLTPEVPGYGVHWGAFELWLHSNDDKKKIYILTGLVYLPQTETGLFFEIERYRNPHNHAQIYENIKPSDDKYDLNKEEYDFLKLFYPKSDLDALMQADSVDVQIEKLYTYFDACCKATLAVA